MPQNSVQKEIKNIRGEVDLALARIQQLLSEKPKVLGRIENTDSRRMSLKERAALRRTSSLILLQSLDLSCVLEESREEEQRGLKSMESYSEVDGLDEIEFISCQPSWVDLSKPIVLNISSRSNWISRYLDSGDCRLSFGKGEERMEITDIKDGELTCWKADKEVKIQGEEVYRQQQLEVTFNQHLEGLSLDFRPQGAKVMYQMTLKQTTRVVVRTQNQNREMHQLLLLRETGQSEPFEVAWGHYFQEQMTEDVMLQSGAYFLMSLGHEIKGKLELFFSDRWNSSFKLKLEEGQRTRKMLMQTFPECIAREGYLSDRSKGQQYSRSVYMDIGLVTEVFENIYQQQVKFQDKQPVQEDLNLLFQNLYSEAHLESRLGQGERVVKFWAISARPASLFVPRKQVRMGNSLMDQQVRHSVFK